MWDLPRPGLEPVFPALAGRFSTTAPPGKPRKAAFKSETKPEMKNLEVKEALCGQTEIGKVVE